MICRHEIIQNKPLQASLCKQASASLSKQASASKPQQECLARSHGSYFLTKKLQNCINLFLLIANFHIIKILWIYFFKFLSHFCEKFEFMWVMSDILSDINQICKIKNNACTTLLHLKTVSSYCKVKLFIINLTDCCDWIKVIKCCQKRTITPEWQQHANRGHHRLIVSIAFKK